MWIIVCIFQTRCARHYQSCRSEGTVATRDKNGFAHYGPRFFSLQIRLPSNVVTYLACFTILWAWANSVAAQAVGPEFDRSVVKKSQQTLHSPAALGIVKPPFAAASLELKADRNAVRMGEQIAFTLAPMNPAMNSSYTFTFNFGDGTQERGNAQVVHVYEKTGSYMVSVSARASPALEIVPPKPSVRNTVTIQVDKWSINVSPKTADIGKPVILEIKPGSLDPAIRYRFIFGDDSPPTDWGATPKAAHKYDTARSYSVGAQIGRWDGRTVKGVTRLQSRLTITQPPFPPPTTTRQPNDVWSIIAPYWWISLVLGLPAILGAYRIWRGPRMVRPSVITHLDIGSARLQHGRDMDIGFQIRLNPNVAAGHYEFSTKEPSLVRGKGGQ
jgi:hypothetical protein